MLSLSAEDSEVIEGIIPQQIFNAIVDALHTYSQRHKATVKILTTIRGQKIETHILISKNGEMYTDTEVYVLENTLNNIGSGILTVERIRCSDVIELLLSTANPFNKFRELISSIKGCLRYSMNRDQKDYYPLLIENARYIHRVEVSHVIPRIPPSMLQHIDNFFRRMHNDLVIIGHIVNAPNIVVGVRRDLLFRHIAIYGTTGSGKSTTAAFIALQSMLKKFAVLIIDWHGEYSHLFRHTKASTTSIYVANPMKGAVPATLALNDLVKHDPLAFLEVLESGLDLTPSQAHILEDAIQMLKNRVDESGYVIDYIYDIVVTRASEARWFKESREALLRKLKPLTSQYLEVKWNKLERIPLNSNSIVIFDLSDIRNARVKRILSMLMLKSIEVQAYRGELKTDLLVVVDEAHNVFFKGSPVSSLLAEIRKWRIGLVVVTQTPSTLDTVVTRNTNTVILHCIKSDKDLGIVTTSQRLTRSFNLKRVVTYLKPGEAILFHPEIDVPLPVKVPSNDEFLSYVSRQRMGIE